MTEPSAPTDMSTSNSPSTLASIVWFTGLSGAGKTTISVLVAQKLRAQGRRVVLLDGDVLRHGLNRDLGFSPADRSENIRRVAEVARLMAQAELTVLVALISPFRADRAAARAVLQPYRFIEVYVDVPLALAEARDPKGHYRKARAGSLPGFTGIDSPYEPPLEPDLHLRNASQTADDAAARVLALLEAPACADLLATVPVKAVNYASDATKSA